MQLRSRALPDDPEPPSSVLQSSQPGWKERMFARVEHRRQRSTTEIVSRAVRRHERVL